MATTKTMECIVCHDEFSEFASATSICSICEETSLLDVLKKYEQKRQENVSYHCDLINFEKVPDSYFVKNLNYFISHWPGRVLNINRNDLYSSQHLDFLKRYILQQIAFLNRVRNLQQAIQKIQQPIVNKCEPYSNIELNDRISYFSAGANQGSSHWKAALNCYNQSFSGYLPFNVLQMVYEYAPLCQCFCYKLFAENPMQIKLGCDVIVCDDHLACTCCNVLKCCGKQRCQLCIKQCKLCLQKTCPVCQKKCFTCQEDLCKRCVTFVKNEEEHTVPRFCFECFECARPSFSLQNKKRKLINN